MKERTDNEIILINFENQMYFLQFVQKICIFTCQRSILSNHIVEFDRLRRCVIGSIFKKTIEQSHHAAKGLLVVEVVQTL